MSRFFGTFPALLAVILLVAAVSTACEKPDASDTTSPSALALIGTTSGNVALHPTEAAPAPVAPPSPWEFDLGNARFSLLENRQHSIQVVTTIDSRPGPGLEIWMTGPEGTVFRWSGGATARYDGVVCFQLRLEDDEAALPLIAGETYQLTMAFRDPGDGVVTARTVTIAGRAPEISKPAPGPDSEIVKVLLGCPRSVI